MVLLGQKQGLKLNHWFDIKEIILMSYVKNIWNKGDTITYEKLNNMENGIEAAGESSGGALKLHM